MLGIDMSSLRDRSDILEMINIKCVSSISLLDLKSKS